MDLFGEVKSNNPTSLLKVHFSDKGGSFWQYNGIDKSISPKGYIEYVLGYTDHLHLVDLNSRHKITFDIKSKFEVD